MRPGLGTLSRPSCPLNVRVTTVDKLPSRGQYDQCQLARRSMLRTDVEGITGRDYKKSRGDRLTSALAVRGTSILAD
jgi:hypothetical protein